MGLNRLLLSSRSGRADPTTTLFGLSVWVPPRHRTNRPGDLAREYPCYQQTRLFYTALAPTKSVTEVNSMVTQLAPGGPQGRRGEGKDSIRDRGKSIMGRDGFAPPFSQTRKSSRLNEATTGPRALRLVRQKRYFCGLLGFRSFDLPSAAVVSPVSSLTSPSAL